MAGQGTEESRQLFGDASFVRSPSRGTYSRLMRQSEKLGKTATMTLGGARQMLGQKKKSVSDTVDDIEHLKEVVARSREMLASARTVLPPFFPDEICLDRTKISITRRNFFWSSDVISIRIEDILSISGSVGPLFGSVTVTSRVMSSVDHYTVERFWRGEAIKLKQIIQGYLIARQNGLRTDHLDRDELVGTLHELGRDM